MCSSVQALFEHLCVMRGCWEHSVNRWREGTPPPHCCNSCKPTCDIRLLLLLSSTPNIANCEQILLAATWCNWSHHTNCRAWSLDHSLPSSKVVLFSDNPFYVRTLYLQEWKPSLMGCLDRSYDMLYTLIRSCYGLPMGCWDYVHLTRRGLLHSVAAGWVQCRYAANHNWICIALYGYKAVTGQFIWAHP